jgi:von Willebrand factor type A domain-containing protein
MLRSRRWQVFALFAFLVSFSVIAWGQAARPLTEKEIASLTDLQIPSESIVARIAKGGVAFDVDDAAIDRLKKANASPEVIEAVRKAGEIRKSVGTQKAGKPTITYDDVVKLLELGIDENTIIKRLETSPTVFTLGAEQTAELKRAGATDRLLKALAGERGAPAAKGDITDFAIVFDCSASMQEKSSNGQTKMVVAQKVVTELVDRVPDGMNLTFVIYGHDKQLNCQAVKIARPLSQIDGAGKAQLARTIQSLRPTGNTPIALALRTAGKELTKNDAYSGIVLVTDGKETCNGDPVAEATALAKNPKLSFGIQVVGFDVKPDERKALEELAAAGKGKYFNAQSADDLAASFDDIAKALKEAATPPKVASNRRALKIVSPKIEMPEMGEVFIVKSGSPLAVVSTYKIAGIKKYGEELRIPSSSEKYDVIFTPKNGSHVQMIKGFSLPERQVVEIHPEEYLGLVKVNGKGNVKNIFIAPADAPKAVASTYAIQRAKAYGETMIVPAGEYNVYVDGNLIEEKLKVEAGKLQELE